MKKATTLVKFEGERYFLFHFIFYFLPNQFHPGFPSIPGEVERELTGFPQSSRLVLFIESNSQAGGLEGKVPSERLSLVELFP